MLTRPFGRTGLSVPVLGLGAGQVGAEELSEAEAGRLLNGALDLGVTLIDTARGYGLSEERIGRHLAQRRSEFVLCTKVGYGIPGHADWTYAGVLAGVDAALARMRTDVLDVVHLHSCDAATLRRGDVIEALTEAQRQGKVRVAAYSGENEALDAALASGRFASIETSVNVCDQRCLDWSLPRAAAAGLGVIAKRPIANAPWRHAEQPRGAYVEEYWWRWTTMKLDLRGLDPDELALRFAAYAPGVSVCIVGTASLAHLRRNVALAERGPLPPDHVDAVRAAFKAHDPGWWRGEL